jgi:hypothetical protein
MRYAGLRYVSDPKPSVTIETAIDLASQWATRRARWRELRAARIAYERADSAAPGENTPAYIAARDRWARARAAIHNMDW